MRFWPSLFLAGCMCAMAAGSNAHALKGLADASAQSDSCATSKNVKPRIDKIEPPNWFAGLPSPMLLLRGEGLNCAQLTVTGKGVKLTRTQVSTNGHWAFLWVDTTGAGPQTLKLAASNSGVSIQRNYALAARNSSPTAHQGFSPADVLYLIMTDRFARAGSADPPGDDRAAPRGWHGGNLAGIAEHLAYLKQLGVTTVWTTPVASNGDMPEAYHGYAATDLYAVDSHFGTLDDYRHLSDELHAHGMKLVIDLVPNHVGVQHPWVKDPPAPEWFHGTLQHHPSAQHDFNQLIDPHAPPEAWRNIVDGWFTDAMPDLNQSNPLVSQYLIENALWWVETANLDGIRFDTFPYVDRSFWHDLNATLHSVYPHLTEVGEVFDRDPEVTSYFAGGEAHQGIDTELYTPFDFPVFFTLRDVLVHGKPMTELDDVLRHDSLYPHPEHLVPFIGNHDTTRFITDANGSTAKLKLALGLLATLRGTPQIYSGDEIGMTGGADPDNRHDFPGGWDGDPHDAFTQAGRSPQEQDVFDWTSRMLALRATHRTLEGGMEQNLFADQDGFVFVRTLEAGGCAAQGNSQAVDSRVLIVVNDSENAKSLAIPMDGTALAGCSAFTPLAPGAAVSAGVDGGTLHVDEPPQSMSVYEVR
ncbi:MAG TPA: alpha-amylase family glycosyl hydrolase [Terracidiphilus sp.]|nr:alpha-amylase family glycosyl hydrolase [Terracidiphilus sp.]